MSDRPNVVLIMADQWRGDCLSVAGHPVVRTPYLDQLALSGARFSRAYSATPTCIPARAALHTGLSQASHGRVGYRDGVPWNYSTTLAGEFTRHGYQTQAIGKMHVYPERSQMGFQNVILHDGFLHYARKMGRAYDLVDDYIPWLRAQLGREADYFDHGVNCNSYVARPWDKDEALHPTNFVITQACDFLRRRDTRKPFLLFLSFHRPHPPYDPPAWAFDMYRELDMPPVPVGEWSEILAPWANPSKPDCLVGAIDPYMHQRARAGYYGHMSHIDGQVNRFIETLADYNLENDTYICFTADHGEMMGDHTMWRKAYPYEGSANVPLLLAGPRGSEIPAGTCSEVVAELRDIMPTLLDCAELPIPEAVEGRSLLPAARGESLDWRPYLHGEHTVFGQSLHYITDAHKKYVWYSGNGHEQLFNLDQDPQERHDLASKPEHADCVAHWRQCLISELSGREEGYVADGQLLSGRPVDPCLSFLRRQADQD